MNVSHLVCCGCNDADWKCEGEGKDTSKDKSPPWHLDLFIQEDAEY